MWKTAMVFALLGTTGVCGATNDAQPFLGRWNVTLQAGKKAYSSWLEIATVNGAVQVRMVGRWGHSRVLPEASVTGDRIHFVSPKEEEGRSDTDMAFDGRLRGHTLAGTTSGPDGAQWTWRAVHAPDLKPPASIRWGRPVTLFNGHDMHGWRSSDPAAHSRWLVTDGTLLSQGQGPDLQTRQSFRDFKLHLEFNCGPNSNSGVYLRGRYEVQIEVGPPPDAPNQGLGGVYGFLAPLPKPLIQAGQWHAYDLTLEGRYVTVVLDGQTLIDNQEIPGTTGGALDTHEGRPGPILLQGSEAGLVAFRNIVITPARD
jgi:hypothetical protein